MDPFPDRISVSIVVGFFFFVALLILYALLLFKRLNYLIDKKRNHYWNSVISDLLTNFLIYADDANVTNPIEIILPKIKKLSLNKYFLKQMLYRQIVSYHSNFTGNTSDKLKELFLNLGLDSILVKKLKSRHREDVIQAIREIAQMQLHQFAPQIFDLSKHGVLPVRMEALTAYVVLNKKNAFDFLAELEEPILNWYQLILIEQASNINPNQLPEFAIWLDSSNVSVVKLCIKLIGHFQQFKAVDKLIKLLKHPDREIQLLAVKVLGDFEVEEAEPFLLKLFAESGKEIQCEIIQALGRICSTKQLDFLADNAASNQFRIAFHAINALKNHGESGIVKIKNIYIGAQKMNTEIITQLIGSQLVS